MILRIHRRGCRRALLFPALWPFLTFAGVDAADSLKSSAASTTVLIAKSDSYLENAVSAILSDSLSLRGFPTKIIPLGSLKSRQSGNYRMTIVMSAIQSSKEQSVVRAYTRALGADQSKILVFTVYGEEWKTGKVVGDAVTGATKKLSPGAIAEKILGALEAIIEIK